MRHLFFALVASMAFSIAAPAAEKGEIKRFRFQRHVKHDFERLVMEFSGESTGGVTPSVRVTAQPNEKNVQVSIENFTLVGAIPEAAMNESFATQSKYLGSLAINTDKANSLFIKANLKDEKSQVDAFWLENPARLVIDSFPSTSPRAAGPAVLDNRVTAAVKETPKTDTAPKAEVATKPTTKPEGKVAAVGPQPVPAPTTKRKGGKRQFVCFPAQSQVIASTSYEDPSEKKGLKIETDGNPVASPGGPNADNVSCFPKNAQLKSKIELIDQDNGPAGEKPTAQQRVMERGPKGPEEPRKTNVAANAPVSPKAPGSVNTPNPGRALSSSPASSLPPAAGIGNSVPTENEGKHVEKDTGGAAEAH